MGERLPVHCAGSEAIQRQDCKTSEDAADKRKRIALRSGTRRQPKARQSLERIVAISRERSETAEYIVLRAPKIVPLAMTPATSPPSTVISVVMVRDCLA